MDSENNRVYAFQSIAKLSCEERRIHTPFAWMLVGIEGSGTVSVERRQYDVSFDGAVLGCPGGIGLKANGPSAQWQFFFIEFMPFQITGAAQDDGTATAEAIPSHACKHAPQASELASLAERLFSAIYMNAETPQRHLTAHMLVQQMLLWWLNDSQEEAHGRRTAEQQVAAVLHFMESHFMEALTREELARKAGVTPAYFSVSFKKWLGTSPSVYLERLRVHRAAELLLHGRNRKGDLDEISGKSGFPDAWYMSKRFRKMQGMSPSAYRDHFVPERAASLEYPYAYHMIALGITPTAARFSGTNDVIRPAVRAAVVELPALLSVEGQKELLQRVRPQIILTYNTELQERLRGVAPVVYIPWLAMSWREHMTAIGRLFRKEVEAASVIAALDGEAAQIRRQVRAGIAPDTKISVFKIASQRCYLYGIRDAGCIFYEFLRFPPHPYIRQRLVQEPNLHSVEIAIRQMVDFAGELNFVILHPDMGEQSGFLRMNEHWRQFEVASGRPVIYLDYRDWLAYDPINISVQLRKIASILLKETKSLNNMTNGF